MNPDGSTTAAAEPQQAGSPFVSPQRIEMDTAPNQAQTGSSTQSASEHKDLGKEGVVSGRQEGNNLVHFEDKQSFNFAMALAWIIALLSIVATLYFWWLNRNLTDILEDKKAKRTAVVSQLESPGNKETETEANDFKASVAALTAAKQLRNPMATFLPDFYTKIDKDVRITSLSINSSGVFSLAGSTASYRAIADQVMALKSWTSLTDVELASSSYDLEATVKSTAAKFTVTAKVKPPVPAATSSSTTISTPTEGAQ